MSSVPHDMPIQDDDSLDGGIIREQDRLLPIANVSRIMKMAVPNNAKIAKDAKETVQECVSEFIAFVTSEASDRCLQEKRKTINGEDILWAMESLGFDNYVQLLKIYLQKYKETMKLDKEPTPPIVGNMNPPLMRGHAQSNVNGSIAPGMPSIEDPRGDLIFE